MVSLAEARSILTQQRAQVQSQRQQIVQTLLPRLTAAQVRAQTRVGIISRQQREQEFGRLKQAELKKLEPIQKELTTFEAQIISVEADISRQERQQADLKIARKLFLKGDTTGIGQTKGVKRFLREFRTEKEAFVEKALRDVEAPLFTPLPPPERITFGQPLKFGESFRDATGSTSFTIAVPIRREAGKIRVQDFNFLFEDGKLIFANPTGSALITEERFLEVDKSRRLENPGFTFGSTITLPGINGEAPPFTPLPELFTRLPELITPLPPPTVAPPLFTPLPPTPVLFTPARPEDLLRNAKDPSFIERLSRIVPLGFGIPGAVVTVPTPIRELITKPGFAFLRRELGISEKDILRLNKLSDQQIDAQFKFLPEGTRDKIKDFAKLETEFLRGTLIGIEQEPDKIVALTAASFFLPTLTAAGATIPIVTNVLNRVPLNVKRQGARALQLALGGLYLTATGLEIAKEETPELRAQKAGEILSTEVLPFSIGTRLGVKSILKNQVRKEIDIELAKLSPARRDAFEEYVRQTELLGRFEPTAKNIKLDNIKSLKDPKAQRELRTFLRNNKDEVSVGGSVAQTGQIKVVRQLGDVDLYLEGKFNPSQAAAILEQRLIKAGVPRVSRIGKVVTIEGKKAVEFHSVDRLLTNIKQVVPFYQNPRRYIIKTPEGIRIQRIGLQAKRKLIAAFADPRRAAVGKSIKDLEDFKKIADVLFRRAELNARRSFFFRESKIRNLEKEFGVKISRAPVVEKFKKPIPDILKPSVKKVGVGIKKPTLASKKPLRFRESPLAQRARLKAGKKPFFKIKPSQAKLIRTRRIRLIPSQPFKKLGKPTKIIPSQTISKRPKDPLAPPIFRPPPIVEPPPTIIPPSQPPFEPPTIPPIVPTLFPPTIPTVTPPKIPPRKPPRKPPLKISESFLKKKLSKSFRASPSFDVLVRKSGKFRVARKRLPFNLAVKTGAKLIDTNLRATFRLRPSQKAPLKKEIARSKLNPKIFRRPKKTSPLFTPNTLTIIERRSKRLSTKLEVSSIQRARKIKVGAVPKMRLR